MHRSRSNRAESRFDVRRDERPSPALKERVACGFRQRTRAGWRRERGPVRALRTEIDYANKDIGRLLAAVAYALRTTAFASVTPRSRHRTGVLNAASESARIGQRMRHKAPWVKGRFVSSVSNRRRRAKRTRWHPRAPSRNATSLNPMSETSGFFRNAGLLFAQSCGHGRRRLPDRGLPRYNGNTIRR